MATEHELIVTAISEFALRFGLVLKEKQFEAMTAFVKGNDVFVSLPTGYGKSISYALLPEVFDQIRGI